MVWQSSGDQPMKGAGKILCAVLVFVAASTALAVALAFVVGGLSPAVALASLIGGALAGIAAGIGANNNDQPLDKWGWLMLGVFALAAFRAFFWVVYQVGDEIRILSPNNLGDLSLHLNFIRYLAGGVPFWPESPILSGAPLSYPLGSDLFNALFEACGMDTFRGLVWTGLCGAALAGWALWRWGGAFALAAFLFNGGLASFIFLRTGQLDDFQKELVWKNLFLSMFVTQRGLLFALPAGLVLLSAWRDAFFRKDRLVPAAWIQWLLYAVMPLFSLHTFLFLSVILAVIFLAQPAARKSLFALGGAAFVPATILVIFVTGGFSARTNTRWLPGWIMEQGGWMAWITDFGITLPLMAALGLVLVFRPSETGKESRCFVWSALAVWLFSCLVALAPWPWDNMKLMMWSWLVLAPYLWSEFLVFLPLVPRAALCFLLFFSGGVSLAGGLDGRHGYLLALRSELDAWAYVTRDIPRIDYFAGVPTYNHPLLLLGRKMACGYDGHLFSHGLDYREKLELLQKGLRGEVDWAEVAPELRTNWLSLRYADIKELIPDTPQNIGILLDLKPNAPRNEKGFIVPIPVKITPGEDPPK